MRCAGISAYGIQRANFHQKMKMMKLQYFCIFIYIFDGFLNFWGCFLCGKLTKPCRHARTFQLVSQQSLASINNKIPKMLTKRPPVATIVPSGTQRHHWGIGIPGYTFGSSIQALAIPPPSWGSSLPVTTGSLRSPVGVPTFNSTEKALTFTIYDCIVRILPKKVCYLTKVSPLDVELI